MTARLTGRRTAVLIALLGALLILLAGTRTWATVSVDGALLGSSELALSGRRAAPVMIPVSLAALAGAVVLAVSARIARFTVAVGLLVAGVGVGVNAVRVARDSDAAANAAISANLGVFDDGSRTVDGRGSAVFGFSEVSFSIWPWVAALGGLLILVAGLLTLAGGRSWPGPTRRYERTPASGTPPTGPGTSAPPVGAIRPARQQDDTAASTWDALSRGEDPTSSPQDPT